MSEIEVRTMLFGGLYRGRTFQVLYNKKCPPVHGVTWSATVEYLTDDCGGQSRIAVLPHKGRCPCMTDAMRAVTLAASGRKTANCDCRKMDCPACSGRFRAQMRRTAAKRHGLRLIGVKVP